MPLSKRIRHIGQEQPMESQDLFGDFNPYEPPRARDEPFKSQASHTEGIGRSIGNPFLTIWTRPRATIRHIVDTDPGRYLIQLAMAGGVVQALDRAVGGNTAVIPLSVVLVLAVVLGPIGGLISVYLMAWLVGMTGRWLGGRAEPTHLRAALAWSNVPLIAAFPILLLELGFFGGDLFGGKTGVLDAGPALRVVLLVCGSVQLILAAWWFVVLLKCVGEVQRFSAWTALGSWILACLILLAVVAVVAVIMFELMHMWLSSRQW
jgi:hypothetical protein